MVGSLMLQCQVRLIAISGDRRNWSNISRVFEVNSEYAMFSQSIDQHGNNIERKVRDISTKTGVARSQGQANLDPD